jgi:hypothetical protein
VDAAGDPDAARVAGYSWPAIDMVGDPGCSIVPTLAAQPAHAGPPSTLPALATLPQLAEMRACFTETVRAQAWSVFAATAELAPTHHFTPGAVHVLAHENNIAGTPQAALIGYVAALDAAGAELVGVHMGAFPWLCPDEAAPGCTGSDAVKAKYDAVMAAIAARGMRARLMLPIADSTRFPMASWAEYRDAMVSVVGALLARYGGGALEQVGMHEPTSVETLIVQKEDPTAVLDPVAWRDELVDPVCAMAHAAGVLCAATLIPAPGPGGERRFVDAAITSTADLLGVNNIHYYDLDPEVVAVTDNWIERFATGALVGGGAGPARGADHVFMNAIWRAAWPMTAGDPLASNAAGLGCAELDPADASYLGAAFAWARARRLASLTVFYSTSFIAKRTCDRDVRLYESVESATQPGQLWPRYQEGNVLTDPEYRIALIQALTAPPVALTATGARYRALASLASGD